MNTDYVDKVFFTTCIYNAAGAQIQYVNGIMTIQLDFTKLLRFMYWKYEVFNLKLEGYGTRCAAEINLCCSLQVAGLHWINYYDTFTPSNNSKCIDLISFLTSTNLAYGFNMIESVNTHMFYRPSNPTVNFNISMYDFDGNFSSSTITGMRLYFQLAE
jgi:hypothetical protein